jgi:hypothetical protein
MIGHKILAADTLFKGAKKIAQSWNKQFKFAPPRTRVTAARLVVKRYYPNHSIGVRGSAVIWLWKP